MKKILWILTIALFAVSAGVCGTLFAQAAALTNAAKSTGVRAEDQAGRSGKTGEPRLEIQAGVTASVLGEVTATLQAEAARVLKSGDKIFMGDTVETGEEGHLQILLMDETVFTLGPSTSLAISEFIYNPSTEDGKLRIKVLEGFFRVVSGRIAHKNPEQMSVDLPAGAIGFRGTLVAGKSEGLRSLVVLLGPVGAEGFPPGRIVVTNTVNGEEISEEIGEKGYGTVIEGTNIAPLSAFKIPDGEIASLLEVLSGARPGKGVLGETGTIPQAGVNAENVTDLFSQVSFMDEYTQRAAQGGMLMPPHAVPVSGMAGSVGRGDDENKT